MRKLQITVSASKDLEAITDYFLAQSVDAGDRFVKMFGQKCSYLGLEGGFKQKVSVIENKLSESLV